MYKYSIKLIIFYFNLILVICKLFQNFEMASKIVEKLVKSYNLSELASTHIHTLIHLEQSYVYLSWHHIVSSMTPV